MSLFSARALGHKHAGLGKGPGGGLTGRRRHGGIGKLFLLSPWPPVPTRWKGAARHYAGGVVVMKRARPPLSPEELKRAPSRATPSPQKGLRWDLS